MIKSLSIALNKPLNKIIKVIGHDGSDIIWPDNPEPTNRRGFHPQELMDACLKFNRAPVWIERRPCSVGRVGSEPFNIYDSDDRWLELVAQGSGVLFGSVLAGRHAWAKLGPWIKDPRYPDDPKDWMLLISRMDAFLMIL
jgi:hypothetical protein